MKTSLFGILIFSLLVSACKNTLIESGEECAVKISGMEFTKSLNGANVLTTVTGNTLQMKSNPKTDYFNEPDGKLTVSNAPVLLSKIDNTKPFTFVVKISPSFTETYDAGALYLYLNKTWWFKFAFERDERKHTRIVTVRTTETSDDNNHDAVDSASVYMKISSDTKSIGFYYSADKENWQLVRVFHNDYPAETWIGVSAQSPVGNGNGVLFEDFAIVQTPIKDFRLGI
jgi:hypothetical protein